jgi:hypothetical protein
LIIAVHQSVPSSPRKLSGSAGHCKRKDFQARILRMPRDGLVPGRGTGLFHRQVTKSPRGWAPSETRRVTTRERKEHKSIATLPFAFGVIFAVELIRLALAAKGPKYTKTDRPPEATLSDTAAFLDL